VFIWTHGVGRSQQLDRWWLRDGLTTPSK
jgi:hypothetical protein